MAKSSLLIEIGKRLEKCLEICREVNNGMETLRNLFSEFRLVPGNVKCYGDFLGDVLSGPVYTPYRRPYTISHYRKQMANSVMKNKRKRVQGNPMNCVRDPWDVSVLFGDAGAVKSPAVFGVIGYTGAVKSPVVFVDRLLCQHVVVVEPSCDVAPMPFGSRSEFIDERGSVPASSEGTLYMACDARGGSTYDDQSEGAFLRGVAPREDGILPGPLSEPCELQVFNESTPIEGSRSSLTDSRGLVPAPPGDTLYGVPSSSLAFLVDDVPEHVNGFSGSLVEFCPGFGLSPVISDIGVSPSSEQETMPSKVGDDDKLVAFIMMCRS